MVGAYKRYGHHNVNFSRYTGKMKLLKQQPLGYFGFKSCLYIIQPQINDITLYQSTYPLLQDTTIVYIYTVVVSCNTIQTGFETDIMWKLLF